MHAALLLATPLLNIKIFVVGAGAMLALLILVTRMHRHPTRPCHRCGEPVRLDSLTCPHCGYRFAEFRTSR